MAHLQKRSATGPLIGCLIVHGVLFSTLLVLFTLRSRDPIAGLAWLMRTQIAAVLLLSVSLLVAQRWLVVGARVLAAAYVILLAEFAVAYWLWSAAAATV